jgi:transcription elongation factor GreA
MTEQPQEWLTQEAFDRLTAERAEREGVLREEIKNRIAAAREEGDLKENGGYHAAREEQGKNEARITVLRHRLEHAKIGRPDATAGTVTQGMVVTIHHHDFDERWEFFLGAREESEHLSIDAYSPTSPVGAAVLGAEIGTEVTYLAPNGKTFRMTVVAAAFHS